MMSYNAANQVTDKTLCLFAAHEVDIECKDDCLMASIEDFVGILSVVTLLSYNALINKSCHG